MKRNLIGIIIACILICAVAAGFVIVYGNADAENPFGEKLPHMETPTAQPASAPSYTVPTTSLAPSPYSPSAEPTRNPYQTTPTPAPTPSTGSAAAVPDKAGASLLAGNWYGSKSLFFGMASAEFYLSADSKGNMKLSGTANAPSAGYTNEPFSLDAEWTYLGGDSFSGVTGDKEISFTCDGNRIVLTANPYKLGLIENSIADMDLNIQLERI